LKAGKEEEETHAREGLRVIEEAERHRAAREEGENVKQGRKRTDKKTKVSRGEERLEELLKLTVRAEGELGAEEEELRSSRLVEAKGMEDDKKQIEEHRLREASAFIMVVEKKLKVETEKEDSVAGVKTAKPMSGDVVDDEATLALLMRVPLAAHREQKRERKKVLTEIKAEDRVGEGTKGDEATLALLMKVPLAAYRQKREKQKTLAKIEAEDRKGGGVV
jgi:hypothetical protein